MKSYRLENNNDLIAYHKNIVESGVKFYSFYTTLNCLHKLDPFYLSEKLDFNISKIFDNIDCFSYNDYLAEDTNPIHTEVARRLLQIYLLGQSIVFRDPITINRINENTYVIHPGTTRLAFYQITPNKFSQVFYYDNTGLPFNLDKKIKIYKQTTYDDLSLQSYPMVMVEYARPIFHKFIEDKHKVFELHSRTWTDQLEEYIIKKKLEIHYNRENQEIYFNNELVFCKNEKGKWGLKTPRGLVI